TADFLHAQRPGGTAYVIGEAGLTTALHACGYILTDHDPDYVVLGETRNYSFEAITAAIRLIDGGARFIRTNPDATGPSNEGALRRGSRSWNGVPVGPSSASGASQTKVSAACSGDRSAVPYASRVSILPGDAALTKIPASASSAARMQVKALRAAFETRYATL